MRAIKSSDWAQFGEWLLTVIEGKPSRRLAFAGTSMGTVALALIAAAYLTLLWAAPTLPFKGDLYALNRTPSYTFVDEKGAVVGRRGATVGERLKLSDMPPYLPAVFLVTEDRRFYGHNGIDPRGLARAALADIKAGRIVQGGSTITQQLVKTLFLTPDRTFGRKIVEMAGALQLERLLTKEQILELYLNRIYLGAGAYGVDGAAQVYFGKSARDVTLAEAAMLATLTNAPTLNSPRRNLEAAQRRSARILRTLVAEGEKTESEIAAALETPATIIAQRIDSENGYFLDAAAEEVKSLVPGAVGDLTIFTTVDSALQSAASASVRDVLSKRGAAGQAEQAALVAMRPDGAVRALVGGRDYSQSTFNRATKANRSPGSGFKPFVYLTALEQGLARDTIVYDEPIQIGDYAPANFDQSYRGPMSLQEALVRSINTVAVGLGQDVGLASVISTAKRLGIKAKLEPNASLALGTSEVTPLELTAAYASFASAGIQAHPYMVTEIRSLDGSVLYKHAPKPPVRVISEDNAKAMNAMLFEVVQSGTGRGAALGAREVAGKTGTSTDHRDAWFIGYTTDLVAGVWVGNDDYTPMKRVTGGALPAQIWRGFMQVAVKNTPRKPLPKADPIVEPLIAENTPLPETFFDGLRRFFDRVLGASRAQARPQIPPRPRSWPEARIEQRAPQLSQPTGQTERGPAMAIPQTQPPAGQQTISPEQQAAAPAAPMPREQYARTPDPGTPEPPLGTRPQEAPDRYAYGTYTEPPRRVEPDDRQFGPDPYAYAPDPAPRVRRPPPYWAERQYANERYRYDSDPRAQMQRPQQVYPERDYARERYAYRYANPYAEERRGYGYYPPPREAAPYGYAPPRYYEEQRRAPPPRYYDPRYR